LLFGGVVALGLLGLVALPAFEPVVPLCIASGYFFSSAEHCASLCIALDDMPLHFVIVVFSAAVMLDIDDWAKPAPANATVMQVPRAKVANVFICVSSFPGGGHVVRATRDKKLRMRLFLCFGTR
jgi:hypothetical protein